MPTGSSTLPKQPSRPEAAAPAPARVRWALVPAAAGMVAMHLLLVLLFYAVLTPLALLLRLVGMRGLGAGRDEGTPSYWRRCGRPRGRP